MGRQLFAKLVSKLSDLFLVLGNSASLFSFHSRAGIYFRLIWSFISDSRRLPGICISIDSYADSVHLRR